METQHKRPIWIWVITLYFAISIPLTLYSFYSALTGAVALAPAQAAYFSAMTKLDYFITAVTFLCMACGAISLFLMKRIALNFFILSLICNIGLALWQLVDGRLSGLVGSGAMGLVGIIAGFLLILTITLYTAQLAKMKRLT